MQDNIHEQAIISFNLIQSAMREERLQCLKDRRFCSITGAQWEGSLSDQFENKPKMEFNKIHLAVIRIVNDYRNNPITVDFINKAGKHGDMLADTLDGLFRSDEQDSGADEAYDNAFEEAVMGGFGAIRVRAKYEDEEDEENDQQRICIEPIYDADSCVFFDLGAKRQDKRDAKECFVLVSMTIEDYKEKFNDDPSSWPKSVHQNEFDWSTIDVVYVAEYYKKMMKEKELFYYKDISDNEEKFTEDDFAADEGLKNKLEAMGSVLVRTRKVKKPVVHKYLLSGGGILEDCGTISGPNIPIIPVYGKRWYVDNIERCMGHVRLSKDAQRLKNMQMSKLAEIAALSPVEKPIFHPEQVLGHEQRWANDAITNYPFNLVNPLTDKDGNTIPAGPVAYTKPPIIPQPMAALLELSEQDMKDLTGNQQAGEEVVANLSGKAVELVQQRLDMQTYIYISNFSKSIKRLGEVWLGMAKEVFVEDNRSMKLIDKNNSTSVAELNRPVQGDDGEVVFENDIKKADFSIAVDIGPSSSSKKSATLRALLGMMQMNPDQETTQVLSSMMMLNMEGEGIEEVRDYFRQRLIKMGVIKPNEKEAAALQEEMANAKPDANEEYLKAAAEAEKARGGKARADTVLQLAKAAETEAKRIEILAGIDRNELDTFMRVASAIQNQQPAAAPPQASENVGTNV